VDREELTIEENYLYHRQGNGFRVLDISIPTTPVLVGSHPTGGGLEMIVRNGHLYAAEFGRGLRIVDVTNPASPVEVALHPTGEGAQGLDVSGSYAYVVNFLGGAGLYVVDVSDPANPVTTAFVPGGSYIDVAVEGSYAYVLDNYGGIDVFDVASPTNPLLVASSGVCGGYDATRLAVSNGTVTVASNNGIMCVIDVSNPVAPTPLDYYESLPAMYSAAVANGYLVMALEYGRLLTVNPSNTDERYFSSAGHYAVDSGWLAVRGNHVYISANSNWQAEYSGLATVDVSDPTHPAQVSWLSSPEWLGPLAAGAAHVYQSRYTKVVVVDVSVPTTPTVVGQITLTYVSDLFVDEPYLYVAQQGAGLKVVNVANPADPFVTGSLSVNAVVWGVSVADGYAYLAGDDNSNVAGLWVVDVSNPTNPTLAGSFATNSVTSHVTVRDNYVYLAGRPYGDNVLRLLDVSSPASPTEVANIAAGYLDCQIAVFPPSIYAIPWVDGAGSGPLFKLQTDVVTSVRETSNSLRLGQNHPNPFNPTTTITFELADRDLVRMDIFDVRGRFVRTLIEAMLPAGPNSVHWDGRDSNGDPAGSGVYFYRLTAGEKSIAKKMVLLR
jgi:hypothetical protein